MYFEWSFKVNYCLDSFALNVCVWWCVYDGAGAFSYHPEKTFLFFILTFSAVTIRMMKRLVFLSK